MPTRHLIDERQAFGPEFFSCANQADRRNTRIVDSRIKELDQNARRTSKSLLVSAARAPGHVHSWSHAEEAEIEIHHEVAITFGRE